MTFAENNRISHRQLFRQLILTFTAPFLLCLFQKKRLTGVMGMVGTAMAVVVLLFYVIVLIRLTPYFENLRKNCGVFPAWVIGLFFLIYTLLTAAYLTDVLAVVVPESLLEGVPKIWIRILALLVCAHGSERGMQRRGRMAEISGGLLLVVLFLMMLLSLGEAKGTYLQEMLSRSSRSTGSLWKNGYGVICAFSGIGLLPFMLPHVEKPGSAWKPVALGILTVGAVLEGMLLLLPAVFGWDRQRAEGMPVLPLLSGVNLPGKVLARFDVLWMGFVIYGLLFAIGSLFYYSHEVIALGAGNPEERMKIRKSEYLGSRRDQKKRVRKLGLWRSFFLAAAVLFLSVEKIRGMGIQDYFAIYLGMIFVPGLLILQAAVVLWGKGRRKKRIVAAVTLCLLFLGGCGGIEPEKRMYPLALGVQEAEGILTASYGMPDIQKTTGQRKEEEGKSTSILTLKGKDFQEIEKKYHQSQEKYLDLGHLQVVILSEYMTENKSWERVLSYLQKDRMAGENIYVFRALNPEEILEWQSQSGTSVGEYLTGILENDNEPRRQQGVTLREVYHDWYQKDALSELPLVKLDGDFLKIVIDI